MALSGLEELAQVLAVDDRRRKLAALAALRDAADLIRQGVLPELEACARGFDPVLARAASAALGALAVSTSTAARLAELGGAA